MGVPMVRIQGLLVVYQEQVQILRFRDKQEQVEVVMGVVMA
jgi:hypothetical protein